MSYKILIVEDNHSFIDSLKVMLKDFSFQFDSTYRFRNAEEMLEKTGAFMSDEVVRKLQDYEAALNEWQAQRTAAQKKKEKAEDEEEKPAPSPETIRPPELPEELIHPEGYLLVLIEQDTETSMKGTDFIKNITRSSPQFSSDNFILMGNNRNHFESAAQSLGVPVLEKPIRANQIQQLIAERLQYFEDLKIRSQNLFQLAAAATESLKAMEQAEEKATSPTKKATQKTAKKAKTTKRKIAKKKKLASKSTSKKKAAKSQEPS